MSVSAQNSIINLYNSYDYHFVNIGYFEGVSVNFILCNEPFTFSNNRILSSSETTTVYAYYPNEFSNPVTHYNGVVYSYNNVVFTDYDIINDSTGEVVFRRAGGSSGGNGGSSSGGNDSSNTSNTVSGGGNTNTVTNSTSNTGGNSSGSGISSESDEDHGWLGNILNTIFGGFIDGTLGTLGRIFTGIGNILTNIIDIFTKVDGIFGFLNPNSQNFIFNQLWTHLQNILTGLGNLVSFVLNFFSNLLDFVLHLVVPTDSQWQEIRFNFQGLFTTIENHVPFWSFIRTTITDAQNTNIVPNDFLIIKVPRVQAFGLFQGIETETQYINVLQAYEPYRVQIRGLLYLIVIASAFVYIIKYVTDYKANVSGSFMSQNINDYRNDKK